MALSIFQSKFFWTEGQDLDVVLYSCEWCRFVKRVQVAPNAQKGIVLGLSCGQ